MNNEHDTFDVNGIPESLRLSVAAWAWDRFVILANQASPPVQSRAPRGSGQLIGYYLASKVDESGWEAAAVRVGAHPVNVRHLLLAKAWNPEWLPVFLSFVRHVADPRPLLDELSSRTCPTAPDDLFRHRLALAIHCAVVVARFRDPAEFIDVGTGKLFDTPNAPPASEGISPNVLWRKRSIEFLEPYARLCWSELWQWVTLNPFSGWEELPCAKAWRALANANARIDGLPISLPVNEESMTADLIEPHDETFAKREIDNFDWSQSPAAKAIRKNDRFWSSATPLERAVKAKEGALSAFHERLKWTPTGQLRFCAPHRLMKLEAGIRLLLELVLATSCNEDRWLEWGKAFITLLVHPNAHVRFIAATLRHPPSLSPGAADFISSRLSELLDTEAAPDLKASVIEAIPNFTTDNDRPKFSSRLNAILPVDLADLAGAPRLQMQVLQSILRLHEHQDYDPKAWNSDLETIAKEYQQLRPSTVSRRLFGEDFDKRLPEVGTREWQDLQDAANSLSSSGNIVSAILSRALKKFRDSEAHSLLGFLSTAADRPDVIVFLHAQLGSVDSNAYSELLGQIAAAGIPDARALRIIKEALASGDVKVRIDGCDAAAAMMGAGNAHELVGLLVECLKGKDPRLQTHALLALSYITAARDNLFVREQIRFFLRAKQKRSDVDITQRTRAAIIACSGLDLVKSDRALIAPSLELLENDDAEEVTRGWAASSVSKLGPTFVKEVEPRVVRTIATDPSIRDARFLSALIDTSSGDMRKGREPLFFERFLGNWNDHGLQAGRLSVEGSSPWARRLAELEAYPSLDMDVLLVSEWPHDGGNLDLKPVPKTTLSLAELTDELTQLRDRATAAILVRLQQLVGKPLLQEDYDWLKEKTRNFNLRLRLVEPSQESGAAVRMGSYKDGHGEFTTIDRQEKFLRLTSWPALQVFEPSVGRGSNISPELAREAGALGGKARMKQMSLAQRQEMGRKGGRKKWGHRDT